MTPREKIQEIAIRRGAHQVGIASTDDINRYAPKGHRPEDILIGAKSVIVFAGQTALAGAWRSPDFRTHYMNRDFPRIRSSVAMEVARFIEKEYGYYAIGEIPPSVGFNPALSLKLCAEMAGLGTRCMAAGIILNRELGAPSFSACITTMDLAGRGPLKDDPVCPDPFCVKMWERKGITPCLEACPDCLSGEFEGGRIKWMRYDRRICSTRAQTMAPGAFRKMLLEGVHEADPEMRRSILLGSFALGVIDAIATANVIGQCAECLRDCPICMRTRSRKAKENPES